MDGVWTRWEEYVSMRQQAQQSFHIAQQWAVRRQMEGSWSFWNCQSVSQKQLKDVSDKAQQTVLHRQACAAVSLWREHTARCTQGKQAWHTACRWQIQNKLKHAYSFWQLLYHQEMQLKTSQMKAAAHAAQCQLSQSWESLQQPASSSAPHASPPVRLPPSANSEAGS